MTELLRVFSVSIGSAAAVTGTLALIARPLASFVKRLIYPSRKVDHTYTTASASR
jgi:hypothetical protein